MKTRYTIMLMTGISLGLCLPLMAQPGQGRGQQQGEGQEAAQGRKREKTGQKVRMSEEGRAIMQQHREEQKTQMKARMQQHKEAQKAFRETMRKETDPQKKLDMLAANVVQRKAHMAESAESAQQARLTAFAQALEASGITGEEREQILGSMLAQQQNRLNKVEEHTAAVLAEIDALRAKPDLTTEDVRDAARNIAQKGRGGPRNKDKQGDQDGNGKNERRGRGNKQGRQQVAEPAI